MSIPYQVRKKVNFLKGEKKKRWQTVLKKLQKKGRETENNLTQMIVPWTGCHLGKVVGYVSKELMIEMLIISDKEEGLEE